METSKSAVLLANEHQSDLKKNVINDFRIKFSLCIRSSKIPRSCSYLLVKILSYFISQCNSVPYLESNLC